MKRCGGERHQTLLNATGTAKTSLAIEALPVIDQLEAKMKGAAKKLELEEAAILRDIVKQFRQKMIE